jgi:hypothetical protein
LRQPTDYEHGSPALTGESINLSRQVEDPTPDEQAFERLQQVTRERERLEQELAIAETRHATADDELSQWLDQFAWNLHRRRLLSRELSEAEQVPGVMRAFAAGEKRRRDKLEVLVELEECCRWLAKFSGDTSLIETAAALKTRLAEAWQRAEKIIQ